jgi:carbamoyltransferase
MYILGLSGGYGHDPAAALIKDSSIIAAAEEERFTRRKHSFGESPLCAMTYCLAAGGITLSDVDCVAIAWQPEQPPPWPTKLHKDLLAHPYFQGHRQPPIEIVSHPLSHAVAAFRSSGFDEAAILVVDGQGDGVSSTLAQGGPDGVRLLRQFEIADSLGFFYWALTSHLGWGWGEEGKVMGLAPYGGHADGPPAFDLHTDGYAARIRPAPADSHWSRGRATFAAWRRFLEDHHGAPASVRCAPDPMGWRPRGVPEITAREQSVAAWGQSEFERVMCHLAHLAVAMTGSRNLVLGGGAAYNCAMNGRLRGERGIDDVYVFPASGDAGTSVGAALAVAGSSGYQPGAGSLDHAAFGPSFSDDAIDSVLRSRGIVARRSADVCAEAAALIASQRVIGWFQGRMELGPRALGCRSILASPTHLQSHTRVNAIKGREAWRPLAPSLLLDAAAEYLDDPRPAPFMLTATTVREQRRSEIPAVVHVDGSCRPQTIARDSGTRYAELLMRLEETTGVPVVLNTSFNIGAEPIVLSPLDAIRSFYSSDLDALVMGSYIVKKPTRD